MSSAYGRSRFMHEMLRLILSSPNHPLRFLVDPAKQGWRSRDQFSEDFTVQAGHLTSKHSGATERLALEDSTWNQWSSNRGETQGAIFEKTARDIGGVPVETRTALSWAGYFAKQGDSALEMLVRSARKHDGWAK